MHIKRIWNFSKLANQSKRLQSPRDRGRNTEYFSPSSSSPSWDDTVANDRNLIVAARSIFFHPVQLRALFVSRRRNCATCTQTANSNPYFLAPLKILHFRRNRCSQADEHSFNKFYNSRLFSKRKKKEKKLALRFIFHAEEEIISRNPLRSSVTFLPIPKGKILPRRGGEGGVKEHVAVNLSR